jgi:hypothetical protein
MVCGVKTAVLLLLSALTCVTLAEGQQAFLEVIRARAATLPVLDPSSVAGEPKFIVIRFNAPPILSAGERYGAVRLICPPEKPLCLAWLFSDTTNIDEYGLLASTGARLDAESTRLIYPATASPDLEQERAGRHASQLPRPWDVFQLHMLGVPARVLQPGAEYLIWFRFSDHRPTDVLLAATFLDPAARLDPTDLASIFAQPLLDAP